MLHECFKTPKLYKIRLTKIKKIFSKNKKT